MPSERVQRRIDALLDEADQAMAAGDWETVRLRSDAVLAFDPSNGDAQEYKAAAERRLRVVADTPAGQPTPVAPALPPSFANGRYAVLGLLGEGSKKVVYRARDTVLKREVAFSLIKSDGLDDAGRERVRREAELLAQLGSHPNIVTVFDVGDEASQPFLVSELLPGGDLQRLLRETPGHRLPLERVLDIGGAVGRALAFAHAQGVIHRDLKPGNVWLSQDGTPKLGDFGLATAADHLRLTQAGMLVGTVAYLPPEQALGAEPTPQADLYACGCLLYELLCGRPPFLSDDPTALIAQHLNAAPVAPSWLSDRCPPALDALILQLLAKRSDERPRSATDVVDALARIDPRQRSTSHSEPGTNPLERLARGAFVGREPELARLRQACDQAFSGHGGVVLLVGEPGIGKTRTAQALETYAVLRGGQVLWGANHEGSGAPAYWPWIQIGRGWASSNAPESLSAMLGSAAGDLLPLFPELARLPGIQPAPTAIDPQAAQFALFDAFVQFLRAASAQRPLLVALDDLHWADKPTLQLVQHLARELGSMRILVVGTYRDTDLSRTHPLAETLVALNRESSLTRIVLRGLSKDEVASYVRTAAGVEPSAALLEKLFEETEGNPFFLSEVVNLLTEEGTLSAQTISEIRVPDGVKEALGRRLDRMSPATTEMLQVAAIIGREFAYDTLTLLGGQDEDLLLRQIEEGVSARVIDELPQAGRYRFTHALMQETLLGELSTTRKVRLHGQVGEALERRWGAQADDRASRLALHFGEAATLSTRHAAKAMHYAKLAAEQAESATAWAEAARYYEQVLTLLSSGETGVEEDEAALYLALGKSYQYMYEPRAAWRNLMRATNLYRARGDGRGFARVVLAAMNPGVPPDRQLALVDEALNLLGDEDPFLEASLLADRAALGIESAASESAAARAAELAEAYDFPSVRARLKLWEAFRTRAAGRFDEALLLLSAAHEQLVIVGESSRAAFAIGYASGMAVIAGRLHEAEAWSKRALIYIRSIRQHQAEQVMIETLAGVAIARREEDHLIASLAALDVDTLGGLLLRGLCLELAGEVDRAVAQLPSPALAGNLSWALIIAHGHRARVRFNAGDNVGAQQELTRWREVFARWLDAPKNDVAAAQLPSFLPLADHALVRLGGDDIVRAVYTRLESWPDFRFSTYLAQGVDHFRGDLALRLDLVDEADAHYRTGLAWGEREGVPVERGRCLLGLAEVAVRRGDSAGALQHIEQAIALFEQANTPLYLRQAQARRAALEEMTAAEATASGAAATAAPVVGAAPTAEALGSAEARGVTDEAPLSIAPDTDAAVDARASIDQASRSAAPVFISYASANRATAQALAERLAAAGVAVWLDKRSIAGGASWDAAIVEGIKSSRAVAVLVNPAAMQSRNVRQELRLALQYDKPVLPLLLAETVYPSEMEYVLAGRQWVEVFDQPAEEWLPEVLRALALLGG